MRKLGLLGTSALRSAVFFGFTAVAAYPALAQETTGPADDPATLQSEPEAESGEDANVGAQGEAGEGESITVTGSRIRRPNLDSSVPVTSIGGEEFIQTGDTNIGDTLTELPQLRATTVQQNTALGVGGAGLNLLDLRGLGVVRTLTLVNGRRHVPSNIQGTASSVDVNTIPNDLIERVDIVTGAQSSVYGSDAIAGVVNFILRRDFEGVQLRGNASVAGEGYGAEQYVSGMYGMNFGGGAGNFTLQGEYARQERLYGSDIKEYEQVNGFAVVDVDPAGLPNGSDGIPDRVFLRDVRSGTINENGLLPITQFIGGSAPCGISGATNAAPFNCTYLFNNEGRLVPQTGTRFGTTLNPGFVGGNGQTGREGTQLSILPQTERYAVNFLGHYEFSEAAEFFAEAKYVRIDAQGNNSATTFTQGGSFAEAGLGGTPALPANQQRERFRLDNPFLNPADRTLIANLLLASDCDNTISGATCSATATDGTRLSAAEEAQIAAGTYRFIIGKRFADLGQRNELFRRETTRGVVGLRGQFNDDWNYEISANYGKFEEETRISGYVDRQRFLLSLDAGRNPTTGQIQCRAQFDPASAYPFQSGVLQPNQNAAIAARLANDIANCVPYNAFGPGGAVNAAAIDYFSADAVKTGELEQLVLQGFVSGDSSQLFELPGGPIRFALGAEYRTEKARYTDDPQILAGLTNFLVLGTATPPKTKIKEAFGELQLPILSDVPFFEELTLTGAGRVSDYSTIGTVYAYNASVDWAPVRDVRFRASYGRSVRAPTVAETSFPAVPNFAPAFSDPCRGAAIGDNPNRQANCLADLGPDLVANLAGLGAPSLPVFSGSNPDLDEEKSDSLTIGVVVQPRFVPGLAISADYYDIKVEDVIVANSAQQIANFCYDSPSLDNPFCSLFSRYRGAVGTTGPNGEVAGSILANTLNQAPVNFAARTRRGIDVELAYRTNLTDNLRLGTTWNYTHVLESSNFQDPLRPEFEDRLLGELGDPEDEFRWDVDLTYRQFTFGYQMRYIGTQVNTLNYEDVYEVPGACTTAGCPPNNLDYASIIQFPEVFYHSIRFEWNVDGKGLVRPDDGNLRFYVGIDNLLDTYPPFGLTGTGDVGVGNDRATPSRAGIFEAQGRTFFAGFRARF